MNKIIYTILNMRKGCAYFDYLKSEYVLAVQDLMDAIFDSENGNTFESEEEVKELSQELINSKKELITNLKELMDYVELLDCELKNKECINNG